MPISSAPAPESRPSPSQEATTAECAPTVLESAGTAQFAERAPKAHKMDKKERQKAKAQLQKQEKEEGQQQQDPEVMSAVVKE